jgi:hypothetical protein
LTFACKFERLAHSFRPPASFLAGDGAAKLTAPITRLSNNYLIDKELQ